MADESYWTYRAATPTPSYAAAVHAGAVNPDTMSEAGFNSLSPGMRREIVRNAERRNETKKVP
jgi:hypothetical protein